MSDSNDIKNIRRVLGPTLKYVDGRIDVVNPGDGSGGDLPPGGSDGQVLTKQSGADGDADWETPGSGNLPAGGTTGQALIKDSGTDGDASWQTRLFVPPGGTLFQVLSKDSTDDGDASWRDPSGSLPSGGSTGQVLAKQSGTDGDADWQNFSVSITGFPYLKAPTSPDSWDLDATLWVDPDLAANGWAINDFFTPWAAYIRDGEIGGGGGLSAGHYRSSLINGQLWLQVFPNSNVSPSIAVISKATSGAHTYKADAWGSRFGTGLADGNENRCWLGVFAGGPQPADPSTAVYWVGLANDHFLEAQNTGASFTSYQDFTSSAAYISNIKYIDVFTPGVSPVQGVRSQARTRMEGSTVLSPTTTHELGTAVTHAGIMISTSTSEYVYVSSIRRLPLNTFP